MAESAYHNEALRRQRIIERKRDAQVRLLEGPQSNEMPGYGGADMKDTVLYSGPGHFDQSRTNIKKFRLHEDGFNIRYRNRVNHAPHCDLAYKVIYPHKENTTYTSDENRNNRRMNLMSDKYDIVKTVNGEFPHNHVTESVD
ncbi:uncharacterized protein LOC134725388 isoform X1 [Mytilus trossulus]|uniref:uncharacterized protein LOC134725388 isoform X1 n=1 Tax=Mytilus trossulus TaxID=6551 RepID=UPI00300585FC